MQMQNSGNHWTFSSTNLSVKWFLDLKENNFGLDNDIGINHKIRYIDFKKRGFSIIRVGLSAIGMLECPIEFKRCKINLKPVINTTLYSLSESPYVHFAHKGF